MQKLTQHLKNGNQLLSQLPDVKQLSSRVWRIMAQNPGPYTLQGTCTYLIGSGRKRILLDTGDMGDSSVAYLKLLKQLVNEQNCEIDKIVISHWHHDHLNGVNGVQLEFGPNIPVYKNMQEEEATGVGEGSIGVYEMWPKEKFVEMPRKIQVEGTTLTCIHTPGHAVDHCVFVLEEEGSMFTADNVLGEGTGVVSNLSEYLKSLRRMKEENCEVLYPGHGEAITDGRDRIDAYIKHREERINQVYNSISANSYTELPKIVEAVYPGLASHLIPPATFNTMQALNVLLSERKIEEKDGKYKRMENRL